MSDLSNFIPKKGEKKPPTSPKPQKKTPRIIERKKSPHSLKELSKEQLIVLLDPVMGEIPGFAANLAWTRQRILPKNPQIHPEELAQELAIPVLEAYVILAQLQSD
jgi:hypothetical protein